jgi:DNA repair ATPase RecN
VEKQVRKDRTSTAVRKLSDDDRVQEIARMFGSAPGKTESSVSVRHARELLAASKV